MTLYDELLEQITRYQSHVKHDELGAAVSVRDDIGRWVIKNWMDVVAGLRLLERPLHAQPDNVADAALTLGKVTESFTERLKPKRGWND